MFSISTKRSGRVTRFFARLKVLVLLLILASTSYGRTHRRQITALAVSPDGKLVAAEFSDGHTSLIYILDVATGAASRLTSATEGFESGPAFSPDGKRIAYFYQPGPSPPSKTNVPGIVIVNLDGSDRHAWSPGTNCFAPEFSPDNKTLVFGCYGFYGNYSPIAQPHPHNWNFFASNLDGTKVRGLTNERFYETSRPSISPDGENMVVVTEGLETGEQIAIYSINSPGPPLRTLRPHVPNEVSHKEPIFNWPNYLPDGSILFTAANKHFDYDVYRLNPDTGAVERLTDRNGYATELKVSADGKTVAFLKWRKNWMLEVTDPEPYLLDVETHKLTPLKVSGLS